LSCGGGYGSGSGGGDDGNDNSDSNADDHDDLIWEGRSHTAICGWLLFFIDGAAGLDALAQRGGCSLLFLTWVIRRRAHLPIYLATPP
jgi:hypothetical protein